MGTRLFPPAFDGTGSSIALPWNVSNSFATLNQTISFPAGATSLLEIDTADLLRCSEISYPIAGGLLRDRRQAQRMRFSFLSRGRYERLIRSVFESLIPKEFQDQSAVRSLCVFCLMKGKRNNGCVCVSVALNLRLDQSGHHYFFSRKWQWVNLNHGCLLVRGSCSLMEPICNAGFKNRRWERSQRSVDSEWRDTPLAVNRCSCNERMGDRAFFFFKTICSAFKCVRFFF